ncbi:SDR family oxidoreductase [Streptomyces sp. NPDC048182]|uniref:SDR family oxidoreductase n=1 Tax=Streptomyces sp. NPDC048182 TaxID=3365507 RepID=UPI00371215E5
MTILVTGARGRVARTLIDLLVRQGTHPVRAASSKPEALALPTGVTTVPCTLSDPATFPAALAGVDQVFLYAAESQADAFVAQAAEAGVRHIVLLSSSSVLAPGAADDPLAAHHATVENALAAGPVPATFLRPGDFAGNALQWSHALTATGRVDLPYPESQGAPLHETDLAEAALAVLNAPAEHGTRAFHLTGPYTLTLREQVAHIALATGRPLGVNAVSREAWKRGVAGYVPDEFAEALLDMWQGNVDAPVGTTSTVEALTGHPARAFARWAEEHAADFR